MYSGIYKITCLKNRKVYVGGSQDVEQRFLQHIYLLKLNNHYNKQLQDDFNEYGAEQFDFQIITKCKKKQIQSKEQFYIDFYMLIGDIYNLRNTDMTKID